MRFRLSLRVLERLDGRRGVDPAGEELVEAGGSDGAGEAERLGSSPLPQRLRQPSLL